MDTQPDPVPRHLSPSSSGRRTSNASPEFEFSTTDTSTSPLLSADELFVNGVLLPLHLLHLHPNHHPDPILESTNHVPDPPGPGLSPGLGPDTTHSKRWKDIFKKGDKKKKNKSERTGAELNINIWPFSRSRSAGTGATRPKPVGLTRKVSSAPCSRSNSAGESKSRKWPSSPGRVGVHLGRASPVWQARKPKPGTSTCRSKLSSVSGGTSASGAKPRVLNLNVPMCIGYRNHVGCRSDESGAVAVTVVSDGATGGECGAGLSAGDGTRGSNMFNFRNLFSKKVY